ncbi:MAG TPA: glycosyltransferase [Rhizomicrobium sp.]|nr:glycosyltransferase [Rhizomicrobium sp.]
MRGGLKRGGKIAILVPTYNGGLLLQETVMSAGWAGLPPDSYEILVSDNASTDDSARGLPEHDMLGAPIVVRRNPYNLGRVENWNCALSMAEEMGFSYALFLMVGDILIGRAILDLRDRMIGQDSMLGFAPCTIVDHALRPLRLARRICWQGDPGGGLAPERFLAQSLAQGAMLFGPLGANLYRIDAGPQLRFDPSDATHTDHLATALFAREAARPIVYLDRPISLWRRRPGRFHSSMTAAQRLAGDLKVMECACHASGLAPDYARIRASLLLRATLFCRGNLPRAWRITKDMAGSHPMSWVWLGRLIVRLLRNGTPWLVEA